MQKLTIGKLAEMTGISADTLRYYEKMKLLAAEGRSPAGYRIYSPDAEHVVHFIRRAKALNFTLEEIRQLLIMNASDKATCAEMLQHTEHKITEAQTKIEELKEIKRVLTALAKQCPSDDTPTENCPILGHIRGKATAIMGALIIAVTTLMNAPAEAKPLSYPGGIMAMQENDETGHTLSLDYTLSASFWPSLRDILYKYNRWL